MAVLMICASHTPLMGNVPAGGDNEERVREQFAILGKEVEAFDPELVVIFSPDHFRGFFYDLLPLFTVGVRAEALGDYGIGQGPYDVPEELALACARACHKADVDVAVSYRFKADHGFSQLLMLLGGSVARWPVIPVHINCAGPPLPSMSRARALGAAIGAWAAATGKRVLILGSGGLSHDPPMPTIADAPPHVVERMIDNRNSTPEELLAREESNYDVGRRLADGTSDRLPLNPKWDREFMQAMENGRLDAFDGLSEEDLSAVAGCGSHEVRCWIAAYAALAACGSYHSEQLFYRDIPLWNAGMGIAKAIPRAETSRSHVDRMEEGA